MKNDLLRLFIMISKYVCYGLMIQVFTVSLLFATEVNGQYKSVKDTHITLHLKNATLIEVIQAIESKTSFKFTYEEKDIAGRDGITIHAENRNLEEILLGIGRTVYVYFKQVNNNIHVKPVKQEKRQKTIESFHIITVSGTVTSLSDGEPLPGANIVVKGTTTGTVTDIDGKYSINVPNEDDILVFSSIGYSTEEVPVNGRSTIDIALVEDIKSLGEVVVVGYGIQKKVNLTGAVTQIDGEVLENRVVPNMGQALQGVIPNLNITTTGDPGGPGTNASFNIRGHTSINGGDPLFVVDGIPVDNINDINPTDVESMSVLKDAAASAIYGARAPYGVVIITTKRGKKGERTTVSYSSMFGKSSYTRLPEMANSFEFAEAMNQASLNSGQIVPFSPEQLEKLSQNVANPGTHPVSTPDPNNPSRWTYASPLDADNVDWFQAYFKPYSFNQKHDISLSGSSQNTTYYMGLGYFDQGGLLRYGNEKFVRYNVTGNIHSEPTKWLRVDLRTRFSKRKIDIPYEYAGTLGNWIHMATTRWPNWALRNPDGYFSHASNLEFMHGGGRRISGEDNLTLTGSIEVEPLTNWKINLDYSYNNQTSKSQWHNAYVYAWGTDGSKYNIGPTQNSVGEGMIADGYNSLNLYSSYEKELGKHYVKALVGQQIEVAEHFDVSGTRANLITDEIPAISVATGTQNVYDAISDWATMGTFARINYNYEEKYLLELNGRYDGSSKFPEGRRLGFFPSISAGYNLAREEYWGFLEKYINEFKLRASYGSLGNQNVANYLYYATINIGNNLPYILNNERPSYLGTPGIISPDLTWETSRTFDVGLDAAFLDNQLSLTFDWYIRNTLNMLGPSEVLPAALGANVPFKNNADLQTKGFELSIDWRDNVGDNLNYNISFVLSDYVSTIKEYYNPTKLLSAYYPGQTLGEIWGYETAGLIQSEQDLTSMPDQSFLYGRWTVGDVMYADLNEDGKVDPGKNTLDDHGDLKVIGNSTPRYSYGLNLGFNWKGLDFNMFWQGVAKRDLWLGGNSEYNNQGNIFWGFTPGFGNNVYKATLDYWTENNSGAYWPKPYVSSEGAKNHKIQTRYLQNGAYLRLKNLQVGYDLSQVLKISGIQKLRIFATGENLLTFSKIHENYDPEVVGGRWGAGKIYPLFKTMSLGVNVDF